MAVTRRSRTALAEAATDFQGLQYQPRTKQTAAVYELLLALVYQQLPDAPPDVLRSATDEVIAALKSEQVGDAQRQEAIAAVVPGLDSVQFARLSSLGQKLTDYGEETTAEADAADAPDDNAGVAVVFDEADERGGAAAADDEGDDWDLPSSSESGSAASDERPVIVAAGALDAGEGREPVAVGGEALDEDSDGEADNVVEVSAAALRTGGNRAAELSARDIDAFWLQRIVAQLYPDAQQAHERATAAWAVLSQTAASVRAVENALLDVFEYEHVDTVKTLVRHRRVIYWATRLAAAAPEERDAIKRQAVDAGADDIVDEVSGRTRRSNKASASRPTATVDSGSESDADEDVAMADAGRRGPHEVDLDSLAFKDGALLMSNKKCRLPEGSFKRVKAGYEEIVIPAPASEALGPEERLVAIGELPPWAREAFPGTSSLNRVQSRVFPVVFETSVNVLLCAPTGAGKTNVAVLAILQAFNAAQERNAKFKAVYVAPMKALVQEVVGNLGRRLGYLGMNVAELTGDAHLTRAQLMETSVVVTTPEKWDVVTRKPNAVAVDLMIVDEVHLLHDERGPVLESIVSRALKREPTRVVGLSATLPNYADVGAFLRVPAEGLFHFGPAFRPCPLRQTFVAVTEKKALKRFQLMNEIVHDMVANTEEQGATGRQQMLVFVHSRKDTAATARAVRDMAVARETIGRILPADAASREILRHEAGQTANAALQDLLPYGFAVHHAGMTRADRTTVEDLFADGHVQVLVSTATLAWGVNLPAHTVVIKGTQVYRPERGSWGELSAQDVLQMLGRAGRPQYDTFGEGIVITTQAELPFYLSVLNAQLPIESQLVGKLVDALNAEIVLGTISDRASGQAWLESTYLHVRAQREPALYGCSGPLPEFEADLVHSAALQLEKCHLARYDRRSGRLQATELGRIAAHFYLSHRSMATYHGHLRATSGMQDLLRVFALSDEFRFIPVREEERLELQKLLDRVPIPVREAVDDPCAKMNVLLQAHISRLALDGFALLADCTYVKQSAGRILRALFEICVRRRWAAPAREALQLAQMAARQQWLSMHALRQVPGLDAGIVSRLERREVPWFRYLDLTEAELGELAGAPRAGRRLFRAVRQVPRVELHAHVQPLTAELLQIELTVRPDFEFEGAFEPFWVLVEDGDGETLLHAEPLVLRARDAGVEHSVPMVVPLGRPLPPHYFVTVASERWLHASAQLPLSFAHMLLPAAAAPATEFLDLQPVSASEALPAGWPSSDEQLDPVQTQAYAALARSDSGVLVCSDTPQGECLDVALVRFLAENEGKALYLAGSDAQVERQLRHWKACPLGAEVRLAALDGCEDVSRDHAVIAGADIILATPEQWDRVSKRWRGRRAAAQAVQAVRVVLVDGVDVVAEDAALEVVLSRLRFMATQLETPLRVVATAGLHVANAPELAEWLAAKHVFNMGANVRTVPLEVHLQSYTATWTSGVPLFAALAPTVRQLFGDGKVPEGTLVVVPTAPECAAAANAIFGPEFATRRVALFSELETESARAATAAAFSRGDVCVLIASQSAACGALDRAARAQTGTLVVLGTQRYHARDHSFTSYSVPELRRILALAGRPPAAKAHVLCPAASKHVYKAFVHAPFPIESQLDRALPDILAGEIAVKTVESKQDAVDYLTWTLLYRRLPRNPNYYGLRGTSHQDLADHLSELVEETSADLAASRVVQVQGDDNLGLAPLNLALIAAHYGVAVQSVEQFATALKADTPLERLAQLVAAAAEFAELPVRPSGSAGDGDEPLLAALARALPPDAVPSRARFLDPNVKASVLLHAHFARLALPVELERDQEFVLQRVWRLVHALVDVVATSGHLRPALAAARLMQMCVQALRPDDSPMRMVPHLGSSDRLAACLSAGVDSIDALLELDDGPRESLLKGLTPAEKNDVARFANRYPAVSVEVKLGDTDLALGDVGSVAVSLRHTDLEDDAGPVVAPLFPGAAPDEGWWLILADAESSALLAIKRLVLAPGVPGECSLQFAVPEDTPIGERRLALHVRCDVYAGCDQDVDVGVISVSPASDGSSMSDGSAGSP